MKGIRINFYQKTAFAIAMSLGATMASNGQPAGDTNIFPILSQANSIAASPYAATNHEQAVSTNLNFSVAITDIAIQATLNPASDVPVVSNDVPVVDTNSVAPIILQYMPMSDAIKVMAGDAGINYIIDPRLAKWWWGSFDFDGNPIIHEPILNSHWEGMTVRQGLLRLLKEHNLVLAEDPVTSVARITYVNQVPPPVDASLLAGNTNETIGDLSLRFPIQFQEVPLTTALESLARLTGINYLLDPKIGYGLPGKNGQIKPEPLLHVRWFGVSPRKALIALCENYDLSIIKAPSTDIFLIRAKDHQLTNFVDAGLLGSDTNKEPTIQFEDVPITTALNSLTRLAGINYAADSQFGYGLPDKNGQIKTEPALSFRFENATAKQAFIAICQNYDLIIVKDATTGIIRIKPKD